MGKACYVRQADCKESENNARFALRCYLELPHCVYREQKNCNIDNEVERASAYSESTAINDATAWDGSIDLMHSLARRKEQTIR